MKTLIHIVLIAAFFIIDPLFAVDREEKQESISQERPVKVLLSLDGGGTRVVGTIAILKEIFGALEKELGRNVKPEEIIDLVGGTSAGGIVALMLASGKTLEECMKLFMKHPQEIFSVDLYHWIINGAGYLGAKYSHDRFKRILRVTFGESLISDVRFPVFVTTYCRERDEFKLLDSDNPSEFSSLTKAQAALVTAAPPTYFPRQILQSKDGPISCEDGGVGANDPGDLVLARAREHPHHHTWKKARQLHPEHNYVLISIGAGKELLPPLDEDVGLLGFATAAIDEVLSASRAATELQLKTELGDHNYFRFQFHSDAPLDTTDPTILHEIVQQAADVSKTNEFKSLVQRLVTIIRQRESDYP